MSDDARNVIRIVKNIYSSVVKICSQTSVMASKINEHNSNANAHTIIINPILSDINNLQTLKADAANTYTRAQTDNLLNAKEPLKGSNDNYVTNAQLTVLNNTSGTNSGDETASSIELKLSVSSTNITALANLTGTNTGDETISTIMSKLLKNLHYETKQFVQASAIRALTIKANTAITLSVDSVNRLFYVSSDTSYNFADILDTGSIQAGKDYCLYLIPDGTGVGLKISLNSTYPDGYTAGNSRKIGGFHTLCADVGTISGHTLSGYVAGDILSQSVWCLSHRPVSSPNGMVYVPESDMWVDIYLQSGTYTVSTATLTTASVYGGTVTTTRAWSDHAEDLFRAKKRMPTDLEFAVFAEGSNQQTAIYGSAAPSPKTSGGHLDTASRRMVSNYGVEECCGYLTQWLDNPCGTGGSSWANHDSLGTKGQLYGTSYALMAGGHWGNGAYTGPRCRHGSFIRSSANTYAGARGVSKPYSIV